MDAPIITNKKQTKHEKKKKLNNQTIKQNYKQPYVEDTIKFTMSNVDFTATTISTYNNNKWEFPKGRMLSNIKNIKWKIAEAATQQETVNSLIGYDEKFFPSLPIGVFTILLETTDNLGRIIYIECANLKKGPNTVTTMGCAENTKESCRIARAYTSKFIEQYIGQNVFDDQLIINMIPSGMPKSGGSGGVSVVTAMLSCLLKMPPENDYVMTGEITLTGKVLQVFKHTCVITIYFRYLFCLDDSNKEF
uniref:Lon proteolytic domain-containing protein n=1 Tax=Meloidogyne javanica TaxID=6303 RepID=A0A915LXJ8_MELJA